MVTWTLLVYGKQILHLTKILQLLKENSSVNITIAPTLIVTKNLCTLKFGIVSIDDEINTIPIAEQIIVVNDVKICDWIFKCVVT